MKQDDTGCLGDCPDAAYYGPNISPESDRIEAFTITPSQLHLVTLVDHRAINSTVYSSIAVMSSSSQTLSKTKMDITATEVGVTSFDFGENRESEQFVRIAFTTSPEHCKRLGGTVDRCEILDGVKNGHFTYCERLYLNPASGTGPDWENIVAAQLHVIDLSTAPLLPKSSRTPTENSLLFDSLKLPPPTPVKVFDGSENFRFLHIIKTGGESLETYIRSREQSPRLDFSTCRKAAMAPQIYGDKDGACMRGGAFVSTMLCGLNCECCAADVKKEGGGFHGTLIRSPRSHVLSQFSHCHVAHHTTLTRALSDVSLYLAESILRGTEAACGDSCDGGNSNWLESLELKLKENDENDENGGEHHESGANVKVISVQNTQAHALTCSKKNGSLGHHFRVLGDLDGERGEGVDSLVPDVVGALNSMREMEWIGITVSELR